MWKSIALALIVVLSMISASTPVAATGAPTDQSSVEEDSVDSAASNHTAPPDPEEDVLGWENGYWYNESIDVDQSDGLNDTELSKVVNRSMARVERVRGLEFLKTVPVNVTSREAYAESIDGRYQNLSAKTRLHFSIKFESRFFIAEDRDPIEAIKKAQVIGTLGFYIPALDEITVISENETSPKLDEIMLAQELFHALQDQHFSQYNRERVLRPYRNGSYTTEDHNAADALKEGDGNYVDFLYQQRCNEEWECLLPDESPSGASELNAGIILTQAVPYSDGPPFVQSVHEQSGWGAVNELYENPPESTEQIIHPEKYPNDTPTDVSIDDSSSQEWNLLVRPNESIGIGMPQTSASNMTFGEAGIFVMFWFASRDNFGEEVVVPYDIFNQAGIDLYNLNSEVSAGWDGDLLVPYINGSSAQTGETGYVWKIVWDSPKDAKEFRDGYYELLEFRGGERVGASENTWRIPDEQPYGDAFHVVTEGNTTLIVNAPSVEDLDEIRSTIDLSAAMRTPTPSPTPAETATPTEATTGTTAGATDDGDGDATASRTTASTGGEDATETPGQPGVGALGAVLALVVAVLVLRRLR